MTTKTMPAMVDDTMTGGRNGCAAGNVSTRKYTPKRHKTQAAHNTMKAWALRYVMNGWRVFPLVPDGKAPRIENAHPEGDPLRGVCTGECGKPGHGVYDATDDPETIAEWWNRWPTANIGLALGNDLVALDLDPRNGGDLAHLDRLGLDPAGTTMARTGGGGWHVLYVKPAGKKFVAHVPRLDGLDVLSGGRYIVAAPSVVDGRRYEWIRDPFDYPPARMPLAVAERLQERPRTPQDATGRAQAAGAGEWTLEDAKSMLAVIGPWDIGYHEWVSILMALHAEFGTDALPLAESWAEGKTGEVEKKFKSFRKTGVNLATLIYHAKQNGWKPAGGDDDADAGIPEHWRITSEDWNSCPVCAPLHTDEFSDGTVRTFHRWCRKTTCKVYRKFKMRSTLAPVFRWTAVRSQEVPADDWRQWREDAATRGVNYRAPELTNGSRLALYEVPAGEGEDLDALLERAADAVLSNVTARAAHRAQRKQARQFLDGLPADTPLDPATMDRMKAALDVLATKGPGNLSTPRRRRNLADGAIPGPSPKERPHPVGKILVSRFAHVRRIRGILDRLGIEWERQRMGGWKTAPLSDGQRIALRTALEFGVPGARSLNSAIGTTDKLDNDARWEEPYPRTMREYVHGCFRDRIPIQSTTWEAPKSP